MGRIFGGFTDLSWSSDGAGNYGMKEGLGNSFIFSLRDDQNFVILKFITDLCKREIMHNKNKLCNFGFIDLSIGDNCNINRNINTSQIGNNYELP